MQIKTGLEVTSLAVAQGTQHAHEHNFSKGGGVGGRPFFFHQEKSKATSDTITSIITKSAEEITEQASTLNKVLQNNLQRRYEATEHRRHTHNRFSC